MIIEKQVENIEKRTFFIVFRYFFIDLLCGFKKYIFLCISKNDK